MPDERQHARLKTRMLVGDSLDDRLFGGHFCQT